MSHRSARRAPVLRRTAALAVAAGLVVIGSLAPAMALVAPTSRSAPATVTTKAKLSKIIAADLKAGNEHSSVTVPGPYMYDPKTKGNFPGRSSVTVNQTTELVNQFVTVSWTNFTPSNTQGETGGYSGQYTMYPVEVSECAGADPLVAVHDRAVPFDDVVASVRDAVERLLADGESHGGAPTARLELLSACEQLRGLPPASSHDDVTVPTPVCVVVEPERDAALSFGAEFSMREGAPLTGERETVERADLHALLFRGRVRAEVRGRSVDLGECYPMLVAERLVELARRAFDAWERGLPLHARGEAAGVLVGVRLTPDGELALSLGGAQGGARRAVHTFPAMGVADVLEAALTFGRSLVRAILRRDRAQGSNLRLAALRRALREATEALREASQTDSQVNPTPEPYRAFAAALDEARPGPSSLPATRLRYQTRWRAIVPGIDLRTTYLCGDRMIVGAASEMWALDRASGRVLWRVDVTRGTSVVTPGGVARLAPDGTLAVHDFGSGEVTLRARIAPRVGGPVAGAVVHLPGLPKLVVVTEGEHHLVAIDLTTGEPRWRWSWGSGRASAPSRGAPRMKRAGKLVYFTCGDGALTALDVVTGAVVWRLRDRLRFRDVGPGVIEAPFGFS